MFRILPLLLLVSISHAREISKYSNPNSDLPALILDIPDADLNLSIWNPTQSISITPEQALGKVINSVLIKGNSKNWRISELHLWATHATHSSELTDPFRKNINTSLLRSIYLITMTRLSDGRSYPFGVLLDGRLFTPTEAKKR